MTAPWCYGGWPAVGTSPFIRDEIVIAGLIPAFDELREMARSRPLAMAAYISLPGSTEVVNTLRLYLCDHEVAECVQNCSSHRSSWAPCDMVNGFLDRHLFQELLRPGERSSLYQSNSSISRESYGPHEVYFYYMNTGQEIARIEVPQWVALEEGLLALSHTLIVDQCRRGKGYPAAIAEAHEQGGGHRRRQGSLRATAGGCPFPETAPGLYLGENRSKRMRWL